MPMLLIQGFYDLNGSQPDGDTVPLTDADPTQWNLIGGGLGRAVEHSAAGRAKPRRDAVDAPETHYGPKRVHQPLHQSAGRVGHGLEAGLHRVVKVTDDQTIRMTQPPEDLLSEDA